MFSLVSRNFLAMRNIALYSVDDFSCQKYLKAKCQFQNTNEGASARDQ